MARKPADQDGSSATGLLEDARAELRAEADPEYALSIQRLVPSPSPPLGVRVPAIRRIAQAVQRRHPKLPPETVGAFLDALMASGVREEGLLAVFLLERFRKVPGVLKAGRVDAWVDRLDNWETCDQLATIAGRHLQHGPSATDLLEFAQSDGLWRRRFAVVMSLGQMETGAASAEQVLGISELLLDDPEPIVQKAVAWAVRDVSVQDSEDAVRFIERNQQRLKPSTLREAVQKLPVPERTRLLGR